MTPVRRVTHIAQSRRDFKPNPLNDVKVIPPPFFGPFCQAIDFYSPDD